MPVQSAIEAEAVFIGWHPAVKAVLPQIEQAVSDGELPAMAGARQLLDAVRGIDDATSPPDDTQP